MKIKYHEVDIETVFLHWIDGYQNRSNIENWEWFYDPTKKKVIFKLFVNGEEPPNKAIKPTARAAAHKRRYNSRRLKHG